MLTVSPIAGKCRASTYTSFTIDDPSVWTRPFTAVVPMRKSDQPIYEYACHEGNYAMASILAGARAAEKAAEAKASK